MVGASKAGTTSLHEYLGLHPEIAMTEPKEPHLMVGPGWREKARAYPELFSVDAPVRGESSTGYSVHTVNPDAPGNIAELIPDARILYLVRDPIERTIAHYAQHVIYGLEREPIERAIRAADLDCYYVAASRYATQVDAYLRCFEHDQILVVDQDDLRASRRATLSRVFAHVGADPSFWEDRFAEEHNTRTTDNLKLPGPARRLQLGRLNRASKRVLPASLRAGIAARLRRGLGREVDPDASPALRAQLAESLAPEVERLRQLTGQHFAGWSI